MRVSLGCITLGVSMALSSLAANVESGKALFNDSCKYCHGDEGKGNAIQDQFFRTKIPRLNSAYVQNKSDESLTTVILNGKRKMPAAATGPLQAAHRSKVTAGQVPDIIAYIRTLKK
jgi:mono/diheme cytochrome c family protein